MSKKHLQPLFAFFGTPEMSTHVLDALEAHGFLPALVVTAPDKPQGRGLEFSPSPVKKWALERTIEVAQPATLKDEAFSEELQNSAWDLFVVAAYAKLLPKNILQIPARGALNVHPSLLPKLRGPSPVISAVLEDERETGVSIMQMVEQMDAGPIVAQARIELDAKAWPLPSRQLEAMLAQEGGNLLAEIMPSWIAGEITPQKQEEAAASYTKKFSDEDALVSLMSNAHEQFLKIRAFDRSPKAHMFAMLSDGRKIRVNVSDAEYTNNELHILRVIPEGKREMSWEEFLRSGAKPML